jgi:tRNA-modifying protein YgfZ
VAQLNRSDALATQLDALEDDRAFVELRGSRLVLVGGADARDWLHDLVTADVRTLGPGQGRRTLVLTPTGRIRADAHVAVHGDGFVLVQDAGQPEPIDRILAPYVLSSDVELEDAGGRLVAFAVLGGVAAEHGDRWTPSPLGAGDGVVAGAGEPAARLRAALLAGGLTEASAEAVERWRVRRGTPRMGVDFGADALPAEAGLEGAIDFTKGCFLGQESVAKVRNLGHPPRAVVPVRCRGDLRVGMTVRAGGVDVGEVTSVAPNGAVDAIVRVRWNAVGARLTTEAGPLSLR